MINFTENRESAIHHFDSFYSMVEYEKKKNPDSNIYDLSKRYVDHEISMEKGMREYYESLEKTKKYNQRILKAIKSVRGKTFYRHLCNFIKESEATYYHQWEIVREPVGDLQHVSEFGRDIKQEWVDQRSVGTEGDGWEGTICVELKPGKYLKFHFSM